MRTRNVLIALAAVVMFALPAMAGPKICGDGSIIPGEPCDDGNNDDGDGCASNCAVEPGCECMGEPSVCTCARQ